MKLQYPYKCCSVHVKYLRCTQSLHQTILRTLLVLGRSDLRMMFDSGPLSDGPSETQLPASGTREKVNEMNRYEPGGV
ncbi:uncharacterized protein YALI1_C24589g [Yarrowia lipolytica]|uniref:Uncharacterized protein n=1 Tax=Yarrowia lipolytica TaxID=4952 RepID=A0A1D8NBK9_YARLL|nr:hypothetical protein YALI1_C24589g [Yarrowia lipolytica]